MPSLPIPTHEAMIHSAQLSNLIQKEIAQAGGYIPFARFMELALYAPGLGYYSAGSHKLGKKGDFTTSPEISPLFAHCIAKQCQQILSEIENPHILEFGAGSGKFACDLLLALENADCLPIHYFILEISADLRLRQKQFFEAHCPHLLSRIQWLDSLPQEKFSGIIFANEVLDAMPVHCFHVQGQGFKEKCVGFENHFLWKLTESTSPLLTQKVTELINQCHLPDSYESEINLWAESWIQALSDSLEKGIILLIDYGYGSKERYHPERMTGSLMCHYQHHRHDDPLQLVGLQDITAHVDFTAIANAAVENQLDVVGYTTQAAFLMACGILELAHQQSLSDLEIYQQNQAIKMLTLPSQMGEIIKVMALSKKITLPLLGFQLHDRRHDL